MKGDTLAHVAATPAVMLSPNATNRVALSWGGLGGGGGAGRTCTSKLHEADRCLASSAVQVTNVEPTGILLPLAGVQDDVIGALPPEIVGGSYTTATGLPSADVTARLKGQLTPKDVGSEGEAHPNEPRKTRHSARATKTRRSRRHFWEIRALFKANSHLAPQTSQVA